MKGDVDLEQLLKATPVKNPTLKPLNQWRDDLYGYWMVFTDVEYIDGIKMGIARYYGTDREEMYEVYHNLLGDTVEPTDGILLNKRGNDWMGGVFIVKSSS